MLNTIIERFIPVAAVVASMAACSSSEDSVAAKATADVAPSKGSLALEASGNTCEETRAWVEANKGRLPTTYAQIAKYSAPYQRAIYSSLSPLQQSALWSERLTGYLDTHSELSQEQRAVISRGLAIAAKLAAGSTDDAEIRLLAESAKKAFGEFEAHLLFASLGSFDRATESLAAPRQEAAQCDCNTTDVWCHGHPCVKDMWNCEYQLNSCGTLWKFTCNGMCLTDG